jgi:hypothetical protein
MASPFGQFVLTNLEGAGGFVFRFFPTGIETSERANWQPQDVTVGARPLFYGNREPRQIRPGDLWLDNTETGDSITPDIEALYRMLEETPEQGRPPVLLASWGDRQERCVLESLTVEEQFFLEDGTPIRARVSLSLLQIQDDATPPPRRVREGTDSSFTF